MKLKSAKHGKHTSKVEVTNISKHGFWLLMDREEMFVSFEQFPWFKDVAIVELLHVELLHAGHLYWPELDVDLALESIHHPEHFPLIARPRR